LVHDFKEDDHFKDDISFGEFLKKKRRLMGLNQTDLANMLGVRQGTISMWELGVTSPSIDDAVYIAKRLGGEILIRNKITIGPACPMGFNPYQE
jgi:transcriptional regulator with XRE-family HTH domain